MSIKVKLSYDNPVIKKVNGVYYVNNNPYRGKVYRLENKDVINEVGLEDYLYSVVSAEMPVYFGLEALKAQSLAARTYAINTIKNNKNVGFDIFDSDLSQVYRGMRNEKKQVIKAVDLTKDEVITYQNVPILALYHSSSGDRTKSALEVFNKEVPYLQSVTDYSNSKKWEYKIKLKDLEKKFKMSYSRIPYLNKNVIRRTLTNKNVPSNNFKMKQIGNYVYIRGKGNGHNVGMSQWGAKYLANEKNYDYKKIIKYYYKGVKINKLGDLK
ncbi:SpoIID/LytB domain-containing protein [Oceanivirga miroungae]|uniref:Amidase enhancer n=1 Tax=Oceanivirga miroungae TaxID=1130046 RepID=A0A6I8M8L1_9FUSO|nr:SpoIID/LytB domain-containing protein [Oceanivirga miroungae]VWL85823.1 Amidase enhancer [Oceanivirga miroungae]